MEPSVGTGNIYPVENSDNVGLSDIIEILNTLDNKNSSFHPTPIPSEIKTGNSLQSSSSLPTTFTHTCQGGANIKNIGDKNICEKPYIKIIEQPAGKALRFRYECEGRSAGSIPGVNSTADNKTYPTIEIVGYKGDVIILVSCVTKDAPYRPHPHNLVGKEGCENGICTMVLKGQPLRAVFSNLGIQCVKKKDIKAALEMRENRKVDPFKTKFAHKDQPSTIDLNAVRLCFQAFIQTETNHWKKLSPVVSDPIYDKKAMTDLVICRLCSCSAKVGGGDEIILLCEKVSKDDIKVKFYEINNDGQVVWEDYADFQQTDIHKQTAIAFRTPRYRNIHITEKAKVFIQLVRPSDGVTSEPLPFEYIPDPDQIKRKRLKVNGNPMNILRQELQKHDQMQSIQFQNDFKNISSVNMWNIPMMTEIKHEPAMSPQHFGTNISSYMSPSPQSLSPANNNFLPSDLIKPQKFHNHVEVEKCNHNIQRHHYGQLCENYNNCNSVNYSNNPFINQGGMGTNISDGSVTPLCTTDTDAHISSYVPFQSTSTYDKMLQSPLQKQLTQQDTEKRNLDVLANSSMEEGPTLSGLLAIVDSDQLININSDDLPLSNLSIST